MPFATISIPSLLGVSRLSQSQRLPVELQSAVNVDRLPHRGLDKRAGTEHVAGAGDAEELVAADTDQTKFAIWINRSETERFVLLVDPDPTSDATTIQAFNVVTGAAVVVEALSSAGTELALDNADADIAAMVGYLQSGSQTARQRFRSVQVEDASFILNREVSTALQGTAITYRDTAGLLSVRNQNYDQNVAVWRDFVQPPVDVDTYPDTDTLVAGGDIDNDAIWYATDDDIGLPQGFWFATSATQPPWFRRLPSEGANSFINPETMPLRLQFDGTKFILQFVDWTARYAGDSTTNPGPTFIGTALSDMTFHQGRFWFAAGERIVSSRAGDLFNLWINSTSLVTDADPIDEGIQGARQSNALMLEPFRESLVVLTDASRQLEVRANGPLTPQSVQFYDASTVYNAPYVKPVQRGNQMYFAGERDFSMVMYEFDYDPAQVSNRAMDITRRVTGYIPAEAHWMAASQTHDQLYLLTLNEPAKVYVNRRESAADGTTAFHSWYEWTFSCDEIITCFPFDDFLYLVMLRGTVYYLERMPLGEPQQDTDGTPAQTLGYSVRCDRKVKLQGVYSPTSNETTWTIPFEDSSIDCVLLAATWDTATVKSAGTIVPLTSVTVGTDQTVVVAEGDWENNADGTNAPAYLGRGYEARAELSEQFVRDNQQSAVRGDTSLMRMAVRHRDSGGYTVIVTPEGRSPIRHTFTPPLLGNTPLDSAQLQSFGEYQCKVMSHARNCGIALVNDTPLPTAWVDAELTCEFLPMSYSSTR